MVRALSLGGVPVLNLSTSNPRRCNAPLIPAVVPSPALPPAVFSSPVCMIAFKNVPVVSTTVGAK